MTTRHHSGWAVLCLVGLAVFATIVVFIVRSGSDEEPDKPSETAQVAPGENLPSAIEARAQATTGYAGSESCRECHADTCDSYQTHPMSRSLRPIADVSGADATEGPTVARFTSMPHLEYAVETLDTKTLHHEILTDADGEEVYDQAVEIAFTIGSGRRGRSYVVDREGFLFISPIARNSVRSKWELAPGYDQTMHPAFAIQANDACISCHAGVPIVDPSTMNRFSADGPFFEHSISCERCHGPASDHVDFHKADPADDSLSDPIVDLASLTPARRSAICYQCHLGAENRVLQPGKSDYSFRPGMAFSENWMIFLHEQPEETDGDAVTLGSGGHVEQMWESRCFTESNGRMECMTCHDPHSMPESTSSIEWFRSRCLTCHGSEDEACQIPLTQRRDQAAEGSCVECHMPSRDVNEFPHTALTEHRILRHSKLTSDERPSQPRSGLFPKMWFEEDADIPPSLVRRANGILLARYAFDFKQGELAERALLMLRDANVDPQKDYEAAIAIGQAYAVGGNPTEAVSIWSLALNQMPKDERLLELIGTSFFEQNQLEQAQEVFELLIEANPYQPRYLSLIVAIYGESNQTRKALAAAGQALELDPGLVQVHHWLSNAHRSAGNTMLSMKHEQMFKLLTPPQNDPDAEDAASQPAAEQGKTPDTDSGSPDDPDTAASTGASAN